MNYDSIGIDTYLVIGFFIIFFVSGYLLGTKISFSLKVFNIKKIDLVPIKGLHLLIYICIILSIVAVLSMYLKVRNQSQLYGKEFSFEGLSDIRAATMRDAGYEVGSSYYGMLASILFGFPVLCLVIAIMYKEYLKKPHYLALCLTGGGGIAASFLTGGRFMAFTFVLFILFTLSFQSEKSKTWFTIRNLFMLLGGIILFVLFSKMFLDRLGIRKISNAIYFLPLCRPKQLTTILLETFPALDTLISLIAYFEYYVAHGINQLDILVNAPYPKNAPYWGGYEFGTFYLLLKKIGIPVYTKDVIVTEIINPGVYFTQIGAVYLDFGYLFGATAVLVCGYLTGALALRFREKEQTLLNIYLYGIFFSLLLMTPIVSLITSGYFPAILVSCLFLWFYSCFIQLPVLSC